MKDIKVGGKVTISGFYKKRTLWQWLTRQPRELKLFTLVSKVTS